MAEKSQDKSAEKLVLFNHGRNPFDLGKNPDGSRRMFNVGESMECIDKAEYDRLKAYKGVGTTQQIAPSLQAHVLQLEAEKAALKEEVESLRERAEKLDASAKTKAQTQIENHRERVTTHRGR